jgi:hypothetical protein
MREPTADECTALVEVGLGDGRTGYACWYPQMGGYVGKCVVVPDEDGHFDAYVWHNGEFPFSGESRTFVGQNPATVHHCDPGQFIRFGEFVQSVLDRDAP